MRLHCCRSILFLFIIIFFFSVPTRIPSATALKLKKICLDDKHKHWLCYCVVDSNGSKERKENVDLSFIFSVLGHTKKTNKQFEKPIYCLESDFKNALWISRIKENEDKDKLKKFIMHSKTKNVLPFCFGLPCFGSSFAVNRFNEAQTSLTLWKWTE